MAPLENKEKFQRQFFGFVSLIGLITSVLLIPFIFNRYLAVTPLLDREWEALAVFCGIMSGVAAITFLLRRKLPMWWALLYFGLLLLINLELGARLLVHYTISFEKRQALGDAANRTYLDYTAYKGHPFLGFTGRPSVELKGNQNLGNLAAFNNFGFAGRDFQIPKPPNTIRVVAMGGSTTICGYPAFTETFLNTHTGDSLKFEVLNFGMTYWTSAHTAVNFILNVIDFQPDYVIFHHAWNEDKARNVPEELFRNDYSHAITYFHEPEIHDKWPLRISMIYRGIQMKLGIQPEWASLGAATTVKDLPVVQPLYSNKNELYPFMRNIRTIIDLAGVRGIRVMLVTQPHSTDPNIPYYYAHEMIDQGNEVVREIAAQYGKQVAFFDLDSLMTGHYNEVFIDLGHMNEEGIKFKGEQVGAALLNDFRQTEKEHKKNEPPLNKN